MKKTLLISILALSLLFTGCTGESAGENEMSLLAINVRKADALLLRCGTSAYLIDTGTKKSADDMLAVLRGEGITRLNGVILTHTHADHVGGLKALLESGIEIENIYTSKYYVLKKEDGKHPVDKAIKKKDYEVTYLAAGDTLEVIAVGKTWSRVKDVKTGRTGYVANDYIARV